LCFRKELEEFSRQQLATLQSEAAAEKWREQEEFARHHHFFMSTAVTPGIYNSPYKVCGVSPLLNLVAAFLHLNHRHLVAEICIKFAILYNFFVRITASVMLVGLKEKQLIFEIS